MATLDVQQFPTVNTAIDVPNIITDINTNTGPQARPQAFGADMNGLVDGLDQASQSIYYATREQDRIQSSKDETWAMSQQAALDKKYTAIQMAALQNGQPIDPEKFDSAFQTDSSNISASAPTEYARAAYERGAVAMGDGFFKQNLGYQADLMKQQRYGQVRAVSDQIQNKVQAGMMSPEDGFAAILSLNQVASPSTPGVNAITDQAGAKIAEAGITNISKRQGPGAAALAMRGGYGTPFVPPVAGETLATTLDNQQAISMNVRPVIAQQNVNSLASAAASGQNVTPQQALSASKELAAATNAQPVNTNPPDLVSFIQGRMDHYADLESQVAGSPVGEAQLAAMKKIEDQQLTQLTLQRFTIMPPAQQQLEIAKMEDVFDPNSAFIRQAKLLNTDMTTKLTPNTPAYDPAGVAMQNPSVQAALSDAQNAQAQAANGGAPKGAADAKLNMALQMSFAAQRLTGVPAGKEQVLTKDQAETYAGSLNSPKDYQDLYGNLTSMYGNLQAPDGSPAASRALQQVFEKKGIVPGAIQLAALNPNLQSNWAAASYQSPLKPDSQEMKDLANAVANVPAFQDFGTAQQSDPRWAAQKDQWTAGLIQMAAYQMQQYSEADPYVAAATVVNNTIGSKYNVIGTDGSNKLAIPTDFASTTTDAKALQDKANVALASLQRDMGAQIGHTSNSPTDSALLWHQVFSQGKWVYDAGSNALVRYQTGGPNGDAPFLLSDGRPVAFSLAGLKGSNVIPNTIPVPLHAQDLGPNPTAEDVRLAHARTIDVGQKLDVDLNSIIPPAASSSMPYFPLNAPASGTPPPAPGSSPAVPAESSDIPQAWQSGAETTHYAYRDDNTPDRNSRNGIGAFGDNPLTPGAAALSPSLEKKFNAQPGDVIEMKDEHGNVERRYFADRTSQSLTNDRIDLYDPHGSEEEGAPFTAVAYRNLGGGSAGMGGRKLSALGESNLATLEASGG